MPRSKSIKEETEYQHTLRLIRKRVSTITGKKFRSYNEYQNYLATLKINTKTKEPYSSFQEQRKYQIEQYKKEPKRAKLSELIVEGLKEKQKSQYWLAHQVGIRRQKISKYVSCEQYPSAEDLKKISLELNFSPSLLEELV